MEKIIIATSFDNTSNLIKKISDLVIVEDVITAKENLLQLNKKNILLLSWKYILAEEILAKQKLVLNLHNSLLPKYRGRHAFTWALINGEKKTGFTLHKVVKEIDAGPIYGQCVFDIANTDNINNVFINSQLVVERWLPNILLEALSDKILPVKQDHSKATYFHKRSLIDMELNINSSKIDIINFIRAHAPPYTEGAYITFNKSRVHIDSVRAIYPLDSSSNENIFINDQILKINCKDAQIHLLISKIVR